MEESSESSLRVGRTQWMNCPCLSSNSSYICYLICVWIMSLYYFDLRNIKSLQNELLLSSPGVLNNCTMTACSADIFTDRHFSVVAVAILSVFLSIYSPHYSRLLHKTSGYVSMYLLFFAHCRNENYTFVAKLLHSGTVVIWHHHQY